MIVPTRRLARLTAWVVWGAAAQAAGVWGAIKVAARNEQSRHAAVANMAVLLRNEGLPAEHLGEWFEECPVCHGEGMKNNMLCPRCEGRCYVEHSHDAA